MSWTDTKGMVHYYAVRIMHTFEMREENALLMRHMDKRHDDRE